MTKLNPLEKDVKDKVKAILKRLGWMHFMPIGSAFSTSGISDIIALKGGVFVAIEVKLDKPEGSPLQEAFLQKVRDHGGHGLLINRHNVGTLEETLSNLT